MIERQSFEKFRRKTSQVRCFFASVPKYLENFNAAVGFDMKSTIWIHIVLKVNADLLDVT